MDSRFEVTVSAGTMISESGARVTAAGGFDTTTWRSSSGASADQTAHLLEVVDQVAEIPQAIRAGAVVRRVS